jgi:hypothetical protein
VTGRAQGMVYSNGSPSGTPEINGYLSDVGPASPFLTDPDGETVEGDLRVSCGKPLVVGRIALVHRALPPRLVSYPLIPPVEGSVTSRTATCQFLVVCT